MWEKIISEAKKKLRRRVSMQAPAVLSDVGLCEKQVDA